MLVTSLLTWTSTGMAQADEDPQPSPNERWIVKYLADGPAKPGILDFAGLVGDAKVTRSTTNSSILVVRFDGNTKASDGVARLLSQPSVEYVEPDLIYEWQFTPNDEHFSKQVWAQTVKAPNAWSIASGVNSTIVAVLDSGVRFDHPDLIGKLMSGYDFFNQDSDPTDDVGHGTGVAGIVAARGNDGIGIAGVAMGTTILPVKVGNADGAPVSTIADGIRYAVDQGADVINLSLGAESPSATLEDAILYAYERNVVVVAAAGNKSDRASFPASYQQTISVGATNVAGTGLASFSSRISRVDLSAPGVDILTTHWQSSTGNSWAWTSGTSYATPMVSGAAALLVGINPNLTVEQIRAILNDTVQDTLPEGQLGAGAGVLDLSAAMRRVLVPNFAETWQPHDEPVAVGAVQRTWIWGPNSFDVTTEPYIETQNGERLVAYYDKTRMEINDPYGDTSNVWFVTNGLLVSELIEGRVQTGDSVYEELSPADVPVAGDPEGAIGPLYSTFNGLTGASPLPEGTTIIQTVDRSGAVSGDARFAEYNVTTTDYIPDTKHRVASVFRDYLNSVGPILQNGEYASSRLFDPTYYATGYPITEAYWSQVMVGGEAKDVLVQCFERRCLTYTPSNTPEWQVEMGNVGQHYYRWRFGEPPVGPAADDPSTYALGQ